MISKNYETAGLTTSQAEELQKLYGKNQLVSHKKESFVKKIFQVVCEPMFLLLIAAAVIYFILGDPGDGAVMLVFVTAMISIDLVQQWKTDKTLHALKDLSSPHITVVRDGEEQIIPASDLVPGDLMMIYEGVKIPADGQIVKCNDLCIDESSLTGESAGVWKTTNNESKTHSDYWRKDYCYAGTLVTQGTAAILVDKTGSATEYGKIGIHVAQATDDPSPLQKQTAGLVKLCAGIAAVLFVLVGVFTFFNIPDHEIKDRLIESILSGVTLAMAMIPEEFPVILTVFLSMGAWRLAKKKSLVHKLPSVETLGAVSVLCVDKTGTITKNQMTVEALWAVDGKVSQLIETIGLACETDAYDPMETAMLTYCEDQGYKREELFNGHLISEYPFTNEQKMMGHVWRRNNQIVIAAKGSPEQMIKICNLSDTEKEQADAAILKMSQKGLRVIGAAVGNIEREEDIPLSIEKCSLEFLGLMGLWDPPRDSIKADIEHCKKAGIKVVMITGDYGITASAIAERIGMEHSEQILTGETIDKMTDEELREGVKNISIFSRVIPEHKMRIVKAYQHNGEIVAMTGDGVNDAPALKYADIGIAMGKKGSEVSREAADLILMDDNFTTIVETVKDGRRIYDNIRKAVGYVFTIHIPIAFASLLAPFLGISPDCLLLLPLHVVLMELMIDPTCSIVLERQPAEKDIMERKPRDPKEKMVTRPVLVKSLVQGIVIFFASFGAYYRMLTRGVLPEQARAMGLTIIILSNLFLVVVNSSDRDFAWQTMGKLMKDRVMWLVFLGTFLMLAVILYTPLNTFVKLAPLSIGQFLCALAIGAGAVFWYEIVKLLHRIKK